MTNIFITTAKSNVRSDSIRTYLNTGIVTENVFVPSTGPCDWKPLLAAKKHWASGKSAKTFAYCWEDCEGFPSEVDAILKQSDTLNKIEPLLKFPEWKVSLRGRGQASHNDLWILATAPHGRVSIAIEGKVDERFDAPMGAWYDARPNKKKRLEYLMSCLALSSRPPDHIYYQLIHRTASAVIMAEQCSAMAAIMLGCVDI